MAHVPLGGFHQVGNQVVPTLQLHFDLGEGVAEAISLADQAVVQRDGPESHQEQQTNKNGEHDKENTAHAINLPGNDPDSVSEHRMIWKCTHGGSGGRVLISTDRGLQTRNHLFNFS